MQASHASGDRPTSPHMSWMYGAPHCAEVGRLRPRVFDHVLSDEQVQGAPGFQSLRAH